MTSPSPVLVIIGPSGSGKSTVVRALAARRVLRGHPTWTTRPRRADEQHGCLEHRFVSDAEFDLLEAAGFFVDAVSLFGLPHRYGLPPVLRSTDGRVDTVMLRAPLVERFARVVPDHVVVQVEADPGWAAERLSRRGACAEEVRARCADNERELVAGRLVADRVVVNCGTVDDLAAAVLDAIDSVVPA